MEQTRQVIWSFRVFKIKIQNKSKWWIWGLNLSSMRLATLSELTKSLIWWCIWSDLKNQDQYLRSSTKRRPWRLLFCNKMWIHRKSSHHSSSWVNLLFQLMEFPFDPLKTIIKQLLSTFSKTLSSHLHQVKASQHGPNQACTWNGRPSP